MSETFKAKLIEGDCWDHVDEFGDCVGVIEDLVNYNNPDENFLNKFGPELNVRWEPSKLKYCYHPQDLIKI